jgi:hypothetical protein
MSRDDEQPYSGWIDKKGEPVRMAPAGGCLMTLLALPFVAAWALIRRK